MCRYGWKWTVVVHAWDSNYTPPQRDGTCRYPAENANTGIYTRTFFAFGSQHVSEILRLLAFQQNYVFFSAWKPLWINATGKRLIKSLLDIFNHVRAPFSPFPFRPISESINTPSRSNME